MKTVLVVPPNDPEAVLISELARAIGLQMIVSHQPHGATLDREPDLVNLVKAGEWERVIVVEMPGPETESTLRRMGIDVVLIDHHHYTDLDRAHDPKTHKLLPSSLEQFLKMFRLTDAKLKKLGFDPKLVRGVGIMDRGYVWALRREGWNMRDAKRVIAYQRELMATVRSSKDEDKKNAMARKVWEARTAWKVGKQTFWIIQSNTLAELRPRISLIVALEIGKPTPLLIVEKKRGLIYVQESDAAVALFKRFGGFTFGMDRCWGYKNGPGKKRVGLKEVQDLIKTL